MVLMHLGLIDGPFVPHNLISTLESPVTLLKFQMAPRLKILMASGSKKGTLIYFYFSSKVPANKPLPGFPTGPQWRGRAIYRAFCIFLKNLIRSPPPRSPSCTPSQRDAPQLEPSFIHLSKSPVYEPPPTYQVPLRWKGAPMERDARIQRLL